MPTEKSRISFAVPDDLHERIDAFRYDHRVKNLSQAVIALLERGLETIEIESTMQKEKPAEIGELSGNEERFLWLYRQLDEEGRRIIEAYLMLSPTSKRLLSGIVGVFLAEQEAPPVPRE